MTPARPTEKADLREALAGDMLGHEWLQVREQLVPFAEQDAAVRRHWLTKADALIAGPLATLIADRDAALTRADRADTALAELEAQARVLQAEILSLLAPSPAERPCDCEHCYCGNAGDLAVVAAWDAEWRLHATAAAIFDRASLSQGATDADPA